MVENSDQSKWAQRSKEVEADIVAMIKGGKSLCSIYDYAAQKRSDIAIELGHTNSKYFGKIRNSVMNDEQYRDEYEYGFACHKEDTDIFSIISQLFIDRSTFQKIDKNNAEKR